MSKTYLPYDPDQQLLLPAALPSAARFDRTRKRSLGHDHNDSSRPYWRFRLCRGDHSAGPDAHRRPGRAGALGTGFR